MANAKSNPKRTPEKGTTHLKVVVSGLPAGRKTFRRCGIEFGMTPLDVDIKKQGLTEAQVIEILNTPNLVVIESSSAPRGAEKLEPGSADPNAKPLTGDDADAPPTPTATGAAPSKAPKKQ